MLDTQSLVRTLPCREGQKSNKDFAQKGNSHTCLNPSCCHRVRASFVRRFTCFLQRRNHVLLQCSRSATPVVTHYAHTSFASIVEVAIAIDIRQDRNTIQAEWLILEPDLIQKFQRKEPVSGHLKESTGEFLCYILVFYGRKIGLGE